MRCECSKEADEATRKAIMRLLDVWQERMILSGSLINDLRKTLLTAVGVCASGRPLFCQLTLSAAAFSRCPKCDLSSSRPRVIPACTPDATCTSRRPAAARSSRGTYAG
jgi:hypothetical protein